jgi:uncharacterized protein (UPF0276 family)
MQTPPRFGLAFRAQHYTALCEAPRAVDWLEVLSDGYLGVGGPRRAILERLRSDHAIALHGVSLDIASDSGPRADYLAPLRALADWLEPAYVSDHLCWIGFGGRNTHDLLPVAYTREVSELVAERVARVQDALGRRILLENASAYVAFRADEIPEAEFFAALCARTGCGMLLDVNNLYVNAHNLGVAPLRYLDALRAQDIGYLHVAGHAVLPGVRIDTHGEPVPADVWSLFAEATRRFPRADVILERDDAIPELAELLDELAVARERWGGRAAADALRGERPPIAPRASSGPSSPPWQALQHAFFDRIVDKPLRFDHAREPDLDALVDVHRPVAAARGLRVYSDAYTATMQRALATNFPALARVVSARDFNALAASYAAAHPSTAHDSLRFCAGLPDFAARYAFADDYGIAPAALADLARVELAQLEVQEAEDEPRGVAPEALASLAPEDWDDLRVRFARALRVVIADHDVLPCVRAVARGELPERPRAQRSAYLVTRCGAAAACEPIDSRGALALRALAEGARFADACGKAGGEEAVEAAVGALALACARGCVAVE